MKSSALILAAGYSSRMGSFKPLLDVAGLPAVTRLIRSFRAASIEEICVVTGHRREELCDMLRDEGAVEIYNPDYDAGMFSSVLTGVGYFDTLNTPPDGVFITPADCPLTTPELLKELLGLAAINSEKLVVPCYKGEKGHPLWVPDCIFGEILSHNGDMGLRGVTAKHDFVLLTTHFEGCVMDMDTPEDYSKLKLCAEKYLSKDGNI